ncbi:probable cation-transporting ATPase 13A3 [Acanthaster planci]|uniref:Cation-transporting ATPase n=1 Tax=Acanthaster planci TaxID=133434 RepID=A0A8B7YAW7_ACAPL|nr:probable cation-transporting ATPase 13A3 [Acanthaster planci]
MAGRTNNKKAGLEIQEGKDDAFVCYGYHRSRAWTWLSYTLCVCTVGLAALVFYWKPDWWIKFTCRVCDLRDADSIIIKDIYQRYHVCPLRTMEVNSKSVCGPKSLKKLLHRDVVIGGMLKYVKFQKVRYMWDPKEETFFKLRVLDGANSCSEFYDKLQNGLSEKEANKRRFLYGDNKIIIRVRPIIVLLIQEVLNPFYIFQLFSVALWLSDNYYYYSGCIILMSAVSITVALYTTRKQSITLRDMVESNTTVEVLRKSGACIKVPEDQLVPGDVMVLPPEGCVMTCDAVLLTGNCIVNESMLTGESVPVTKTPLPCAMGSDGEEDSGYNADKHKRHTLYCGTHIIQTRYYGGEMVKAVVVRTGFSTAKGNLVRSILYPKPMDFSMLKDAILFLCALATFAVIGIIYAIVVFVNFGNDGSYIVRRALDVITIAVPPALPASLTIGMLFAQLRLKSKGIFCISPQRINTCGSLNVVCFDKTGTLTEDGLDLMGVQLAGSGIFGELKTSVADDTTGHHLAAMATCHSLTIINGELSGDPIDLKMFQATGWDLEEPTSKETTNFDILVPTIVRSPLKTDEREIGVLRQFPFSSDLQRMSVITRTLSEETMRLYVKGSPEMIASLSKLATIPANFQDQLNSYTQDGFRVLALATKELDPNLTWHKARQINRSQVENDLIFLGLLIMQNKLKPETKPVIQELQAAGIRTVMVTGDNILTAINVARKCDMIPAGEDIVRVEVEEDNEGNKLRLTRLTGCKEKKTIGQDHLDDGDCDEIHLQIESTVGRRTHYAIDGKSFKAVRGLNTDALATLAVQGTVFARMTPDQKAQLVESLQDLEYRVGMCGDGANDCGALKAAHAGVALTETEASVASPFTSKIQNISCIPTVVKDGRAALVTSFGMFKFLALYSMIQFITVIICYSFHSFLSDFMFMYADIFVCTTVVLFMGRNDAYHVIAPKKPPSKLAIFPVIFSVITQVAIQAACQVAVFFILQEQPWFVPLVPEQNSKNLVAWETTSVFLVSMFQYSTVAIIYTPRKPYRRAIYTNYLYLVDLIIIHACSLVILFYPPTAIEDLFKLKHIPSFRFKGIIFGVVLLNFILSALVELVLVSSRTLMGFLSCKRFRKVSLPTYEEFKIKPIRLSDDS